MGYDAYHLAVSLALGAHHLVGQLLKQHERAAEAIVHKPQLGAAQHVGVAHAQRIGGSLLHPGYGMGQRRRHLLETAAHGLGRTPESEGLCHRTVHLDDAAVEIEYGHPHRRHFDKLLEEVVLLHDAKTLGLQAVHHRI